MLTSSSPLSYFSSSGVILVSSASVNSYFRTIFIPCLANPQLDSCLPRLLIASYLCNTLTSLNHLLTTTMDGPPPIIIGLEGLILHALPRITRFRSAAAAMTNFGRLSPFLKKLQVSILLLGSIYRKFSQYDMIAGSDLCLGICHDSLVQTQGMLEAVLQAPDGNNVYELSAEVLIERLPEEISSFISSVELLRSTYQELVLPRLLYDFLLLTIPE
jgi:hypothetical protein